MKSVNKSYIIIGTLIFIFGISGIFFVTLNSIYTIGDEVENVIEGENVSEGVVNTILNGVILYVTTGFFICGIGGGPCLIYLGISKKS